MAVRQHGFLESPLTRCCDVLHTLSYPRVGKNEKTKVIAKLQSKAGGPPVREPAGTSKLMRSSGSCVEGPIACLVHEFLDF